MKPLTSNTKYKSTFRSTNMLRAAAALTLITASGISAYAQDLSFEQSRFYNESAVPLKVLSFNFGKGGIDVKSVSFLESQKEIDFKNSIYSEANRASTSKAERSFLIKKSNISEPIALKKSPELTAGLSKRRSIPVSASSVSNSSLERFKPQDLVVLAQDLKTTPKGTETPLFPSKNNPQFADAGINKTYSEIMQTTLLP